MSVLKKIGKLLSPAPGRLEHTVYLQCSRCGEHLTASINLRNDLSLEYGEEGQPDSYYCRKLVMGNGMCFQQIEIELTFDTSHTLLEQKISGGRFISREAYESEGE